MRKTLIGLTVRAVCVLVLVGGTLFLRQGISNEPADGTILEAEDSQSETALVEKVNQYIKDKNYQKAIPILEKLHRIHPNDQKLKSFLTGVYIAQGNVLQSQGKLDQSLDLLAKSKRLIEEVGAGENTSVIGMTEAQEFERDLSNLKKYLSDSGKTDEQAIADEKARALLNQAADSYKDKQYKLAKNLTLEALQYQPQNALAYELLGDCEYYSQNLSAAKQAYEKAFLNDANSRVKGKLEKITKEINFDSKFAEYADEHFLIRYKRSERFEGSEIREYLRDAYREVSHDFGHYLDYKTVVILYSKGEYEEVANMPHWSGALYDGKIRIPIGDAHVDSKNLKKYIQHELTHVFIIDLSNNQCPTWLHEGIAQYEENKVIPIDLSFLKKMMKSRGPLTWEDLGRGVAESKSQADAILFYHQTFSMAKYMIEKYRFVKIKALLKELGKKTPIEDAFMNALSVSMQEFFEQWQKNFMASNS